MWKACSVYLQNFLVDGCVRTLDSDVFLRLKIEEVLKPSCITTFPDEYR